MNFKNMSVVFTGVGGQGVILASDLLSEVALIHGMDVKKAEVHGMAQRGGSVISYVKFGNKIFSPLVEKRSADILCSFEPLEAIRYIDFIKEDGFVITNTVKNFPLTAIFGKIPYPDNPIELLYKFTSKVYEIDALKIALEIKSPNVVNVVLLGAISKLLPFSDDEWFRAIQKKVKAKFVEVNKQAFSKGKEAISF
ncbi:MAG: indolepyruvate oxidoreductase subunit beta [Deltaproteobacteria bacterium]|nr:indolepyruvate oxidoreductase subunit beta [Deltaproteobacteria bacterium]